MGSVTTFRVGLANGYYFRSSPFLVGADERAMSWHWRHSETAPSRCRSLHRQRRTWRTGAWLDGLGLNRCLAHANSPQKVASQKVMPPWQRQTTHDIRKDCKKTLPAKAFILLFNCLNFLSSLLFWTCSRRLRRNCTYGQGKGCCCQGEAFGFMGTERLILVWHALSHPSHSRDLSVFAMRSSPTPPQSNDHHSLGKLPKATQESGCLSPAESSFSRRKRSRHPPYSSGFSSRA